MNTPETLPDGGDMLLTPKEQWLLINQLLRERGELGAEFHDIAAILCFALLCRLGTILLDKVMRGELAIEVRGGVAYVKEPKP